MRVFLIPVAVAVGILASSAGAYHCTAYSTSTPELDTHPSLIGRWYWDHDPCQPECMWSTWVYEESNGINGLQRADEVHDDTCHGLIEGDTIIF